MAHATTTRQRFPKEYNGFTDCYLAHHNTPSCNKVDLVCTIVSVLYLYLQANRKKPPLDHFFKKKLFEQPLLLVLSDFAPQSGFRMHHMLWRWKCICWGVSENYL
jgi:hypothetical protein